MEFLYRNAPAYKGNQAQPTQRTGLLAGLGSVGRGAAPAYKTLAGSSAQAPAPTRNWLRSLAVTPSYKTAALCAQEHTNPCAPSLEEGVSGADPAGGCDEPAMQVVIL